MITNLGKMHIKRFLAGWEPDLGRSISFGIGESADSPLVDRLDYEIGRVDVVLTTYDFVQDKIIFKGVIDEVFDGVVYEVGLYSTGANSGSLAGSRLLLSFDSDTEYWMQGVSAATYATTNTRVGNDSVVVAPAANGSITVTYSDILIDLSGQTAADTFALAFRTANAFTSSIRYRFYTDTSNYYDVTVPSSSIVTGFNIVNISVAAAVPTGAPRWGEITKVEVTVNATAGGAASVQLEGIRIEDRDNTDAGHILIARTKLAVPFVKAAGTIQEVEFPLGVTI